MSIPSRLLLLDTNIVILMRGGAIGQAIDDRFQPPARAARSATLGRRPAFAQFRGWGESRSVMLSGRCANWSLSTSEAAALERYAESTPS
jgi:hypothetical protein